MRVTRAVTHIHLCDVNHAKLEALDRLAAEYLRLCQQYTTAFCTEVQPDKYLAPCFASTLSQRWQRVVIQHAAGIAQSWRSNYANASQDYLDLLAAYEEGHEDGERAPVWKEWHTPLLKEAVIQANVNVARLEASEDSGFDYWLCLSTLEKGQPLWLPVKLAAYHRQTLAGKALNTSTTLIRKQNGWWLTLSFDEQVPVDTPKNAPVIGVDVGIANFITTSTGKQYGSFNGKLTERHKRDREKRRRKAKLRACLKKKGVKRLPSTRNKKLARQVRQEINRAVNQLYADYPDAQFAYEQLNVAGMKFKARRMNAYLYASNLAHLPKQLAWGAAKRGIRARRVKSAYSSQECHHCHCVSRANRPNQQTFCCVVCGHTTHADINAAENLASRLNDQELAACTDRKAIKALLARRHQDWQNIQRLAVVQPPAELLPQPA
ncbi:MAG TPA: transposase [Ktedonobacterales bacterium]|nr:transposase [Ktedonobacterales bacterium]